VCVCVCVCVWMWVWMWVWVCVRACVFVCKILIADIGYVLFNKY
jgi:hypothetical protein